MEIYEDLRLDVRDKIPKQGFFAKLFKKDCEIAQENLDFLDNYCEKQERDEKSLKVDSTFSDIAQNDITLNDAREAQDGIVVNTKEKDAVLSVEFQECNISFKFVCIVFASMFVVFLLFVPKIHIRNNIYYVSRDIIGLQAHLESLKEENKHIKKQLEDIKFKNLTQELDF